MIKLNSLAQTNTLGTRWSNQSGGGTAGEDTELAWTSGVEPVVVEGDQPILEWTGSWIDHTIVRSRLLTTTGFPITDWSTHASSWSAQTLESYELPGWEETIQAEYEDDLGATTITSEKLSFTVQEAVEAANILSSVVTQFSPIEVSTQDYISGVFSAANPVKAALVFISGASDTDQEVEHARMAVGAVTADGGGAVICYRSESLSGSSNTIAGADAEVAMLIQSINTIIVLKGSATLLTDGIRIDWSIVSPAETPLAVHVVLLGGELITGASLRTWTQANNGDTNVNFGFIPDLIWAFSGNTPFNNSNDTNARFMTGVCANNGGIAEQIAYSYAEQGSQNPSVPRMALYEGDIINRLRANSNTTIEVSVEVSNLDNVGQVTFTGSPGNGNPSDFPIAALALEFDATVKARALTTDMPTVGGIHSFTGFSDLPVLAMLFPSMLTSINTNTSGANAGVFGISAISNNGHFCTSMTIQDTNPTNTFSIDSIKPVGLNSPDGLDLFEADFSQLAEGSVELNFSTADSTVRKTGIFVLTKAV